MTAPSNANTSGLEVVAKVVSAHGDPEAFGEREIEVVADLSRIPYRTDLVTAASAQARVAELVGRNDLLAGSNDLLAGLAASATDRATAAEARADRLATSTADIVLALRGFIVSLPDDLCEKSDAFTELTEALERAALQQEG